VPVLSVPALESWSPPPPAGQARSQTSERGCVSERRMNEGRGAAGAEEWVREGLGKGSGEGQRGKKTR